jgi:hypothetical protein
LIAFSSPTAGEWAEGPANIPEGKISRPKLHLVQGASLVKRNVYLLHDMFCRTSKVHSRPKFGPSSKSRRLGWAMDDSRMSSDFLRGTSKSIGGDLDIDDECSEQCRFELVQSLHHGSVGYQPVHTRIGLAKKAMSLQANQKHKQEQERTISNYR